MRGIVGAMPASLGPIRRASPWLATELVGIEARDRDRGRRPRRRYTDVASRSS